MMPGKPRVKMKSLLELMEFITTDEALLVDILAQIVREHLPDYCKEKIAYNVPYFYGNKGICILWPASIPGGGIKSGVLLGFWYGNRLADPHHYLDRGTNKRIYYKIFQSPEDVDLNQLGALMKEAIILDKSWK